jgi:iron(III) transport system permease protein
VAEHTNRAHLRTLIDQGTTLLIIVAAALAILIVLPLLSLFREAFTDIDGRLTLENFSAALSDARNQVAIWNTIGLSLVVATLSLAFGALFSFGLSRTAMPLKRTLRGVALISIMSPSFLTAFAYVLLLGPNSGLVNELLRLLLGLTSTVGPFNIYTAAGFVMLSVPQGIGICILQLTPALASIDSSVEEASRIAGAGPIATMFGITFRLISPALLSGFILTFTLTLATYGTPQVLGINVLSIAIRKSLLIVDDLKEAAVLSVVATVIAIAAVVIYRSAITAQKRYETVGHRGAHSNVFEIGRWKHVLTAMIVAYASLACIVPYGALVYASLLRATSVGLTYDNLTLAHYYSLITDDFTRNALVNSIILSATSAVGVIILGILAGYILVRTRSRWRALLDYVAILPLGLAGTAFGIAVLVTYLNPPLQSLGLPGTLTILWLAYVAHYISFGVRGVQTALVQISTELTEAARMCGSSRMQALRDIDLPLMWGAVISTSLLVVVLCFPELSMSIMLRSVDTQVVATALLGRWEGQGGLQSASAMAVLMFAMIAMVLGVIHSAMARRAKSEHRQDGIPKTTASRQKANQ